MGESAWNKLLLCGGTAAVAESRGREKNRLAGRVMVFDQDPDQP